MVLFGEICEPHISFPRACVGMQAKTRQRRDSVVDRTGQKMRRLVFVDNIARSAHEVLLIQFSSPHV